MIEKQVFYELFHTLCLNVKYLVKYSFFDYLTLVTVEKGFVISRCISAENQKPLNVAKATLIYLS